MKAIAFLDWSLDVECPHCKLDVDLVDYEANHGDNDIANLIFSNRWDKLIGYDIECPHCHTDFKLDKVEY